MNASHPPIRWTAWFRWLLVTFIGLVAGLAVFFLVGVTLGEFIDQAFPPFVFGVILGAIFGSAFGVAHRLFLRRYLPGIGAWVPATAAAFALAAAIIFGLLDGEGSESSILLRISHGALAGLSLGVGQWLVLRGKLRRLAYLWVAFSVVGWTLGELTGIILTDLAEEPLPLMATFLVGASLSGVGMVWLLQRHFQTETA